VSGDGVSYSAVGGGEDQELGGPVAGPSRRDYPLSIGTQAGIGHRTAVALESQEFSVDPVAYLPPGPMPMFGRALLEEPRRFFELAGAERRVGSVEVGDV